MNPLNKPSSSFYSLTGKDLPFEQIADTAPVLMWVCDKHKYCHFLNRRWFDFTGGTAAQELGEKWMNNIHPDDRLRFTLDFDLALTGHSDFNYEYRLKRKDGDYRWVAGSATVLNTAAGDFAGYIGSCFDVHELKERHVTSEEELGQRILELEKENENSQSKNRLVQAILDSTLSVITVVNADLNYVNFNERAEQYSGKKRAEVIGKNIFDVFPSFKGTDVETNVRKALAGEMVQEEPRDSLLQKGKFFEVFYLPLRTQPSSAVEGVIIKLHDVTELMLTSKKLIESNKKLEDQNRQLQRQTQFIETLFDSTVDVIAVFDTNYHFISINKGATEKYGYEKEKIIGKHIIEVFPTVEHSGMYRDLQRAMNGEFVYDLSYTSRVLNNRNFQNYYVPLVDSQENVYAVMVIGHDITDLVQATEKATASNEILAQKNKELERSNQELEQFAYVASHDLQEPIRKIATYANKLLTRSKDNLSEETITYLKRINNSTGRMYELINGLLLYSRVTRHGNLFVPTALDHIVKLVLNDFELKILQKKAVIQYNRLPELEAVPVQMNQMFSNLISNSLKFTKKDVTPVIQISSSDLTDEQKNFYQLNEKVRYVNIFYLDNGIGFEQQHAEKIFELFQRLHDRHVYEGSGIGLSICKKIVTNHNGLIYAFSEPDKGVTFQIILPYSQKSFI
jgi:PAS domain S-box-containing protein